LRNASKWKAYRTEGVRATPEKRHIENVPILRYSVVEDMHVVESSVTLRVRLIRIKKAKKET